MGARLRQTCPDGIDVFFDNVGGEILDAALGQLALHGRVVLCGAISQYDTVDLAPGPRNVINLIPQRGRMEGFILLLVATIGLCYVFEIVLARPDWGELALGFRPRLQGAEALYVAIGILGATVMPHNLYLHSALVQTRQVARTKEGMRQANRYNLVDSL